MKTLGLPLARRIMFPGTYWKLSINVNGFAGLHGSELSTQAGIGRIFELIGDSSLSSSGLNATSRFQVRFLEDNYQCWLNFSEIQGRAFSCDPAAPTLLVRYQIINRLSKVIDWVKHASNQSNKYLWGGTIGPDFDCSGLVQAAFSSQGIWLPRDAYQQKSFCEPVEISLDNYQKLQCGDLLFFGTFRKCTHVGIYSGDDHFWHSSGIENGHNGISLDPLRTNSNNEVASYYLSKLIGAGRVVRSYEAK